MSEEIPDGDVHAPCRRIMAALEAGTIAALRAENAELRKKIEILTRRLDGLEWRLKQNSKNSSRPPSSDPPSGPGAAAKRPSGRAPGGQPGHPGHTRPLLGPDQVDQIVDVKPPQCGDCGGPLSGTDPDPVRHQVTEIPPIEPDTTEYRLHRLTCRECGTSTRADLSDGVPSGICGPRLTALVAYLSGQGHLSKRGIEELLRDVLGVRLSLGSVVAAERAVSEAVRNPVEAALSHVRRAREGKADETGWPQKHRLGWLWTMATSRVTAFRIDVRRSAEAAREFLGDFRGILGSDRWGAYNSWPLSRRQICWAHLKRDFQSMVDRGGPGARIGKALLHELKCLFLLWRRVRDRTLSRATFRRTVSRMRFQRVIRRRLHEGRRLRDGKTSGMCRKILDVFPALWTFVRVPGVEPTNNRAERALRPAVIYRKVCFGTQSPDGSRFVERMLTVVTTLRQQARPVFEFLVAACQAALFQHPAPSLLKA